jgi:hypothetical protein
MRGACGGKLAEQMGFYPRVISMEQRWVFAPAHRSEVAARPSGLRFPSFMVKKGTPCPGSPLGSLVFSE